MKLLTVSLIPIELYTANRRTQVEAQLLQNESICATSKKIKPIFAEIGGRSSALYDVAPAYCDNAFIAFHESSLCLVINKEVDNWVLNHASVVNELEQRKQNHAALINNTSDSPLHKFLASIQKACDEFGEADYGAITPAYVFSFYLIERAADEQVAKDQIIKLVEPSIIDMDDMLSSESNVGSSEASIKQSAINAFVDVDIANNCETFASWATIVSICQQGDAAEKSKNLLTALELRLQMVWNKCYAISHYIDDVFDKRAAPSDIDELFWSFSKTLDDAKSVLSSTFSSRAEQLFREIVKTSKVDGEIFRLDQKVLLLEKYIDRKNADRSRKYQKTIELLLFVTALASSAHIFFEFPIRFMNEYIGISIMATLTALGIYVIFKNK